MNREVPKCYIQCINVIIIEVLRLFGNYFWRPFYLQLLILETLCHVVRDIPRDAFGQNFDTSLLSLFQVLAKGRTCFIVWSKGFGIVANHYKQDSRVIPLHSRQALSVRGHA